MIDRHLTLCTTCRDRLQGKEPLDEEIQTFLHGLLVKALDTPVRHFNYRRVVAYVDDDFNEAEREMADGHLADCALCRLQVSELRAFKMELQERPPLVPSSVRLLARQKETGLSNAWLSWHAWRASGKTLGSRWSIAALATALVLALAASLFLMVTFTRRSKTPEREAASTRQAPSAPEISKRGQPPLSQTPDAGALPLQNIPNLGPGQPMSRGDDRNAQEWSIVPGKKDSTPVDKAAAGPTAVTLNDGPGQLRLEADRPLETLEELDPVTRGQVLIAFNKQRLTKPESIKDLEPSTEFRGPNTDQALSQESSPLKHLSPVNVVLREDQPTFKWVPHPDAVGYRVRVFDDQDRKVTESPLLPPVDSWQPVAKLLRARHGLIYSWKLIAVLRDGQELVARRRTGPPKFILLGEDNLERLQKLERSHPGYHLLLGIAYADSGLTALAEQELAKLQKANPKSAFAAQLLRSVRSWSAVK